MVGDVGMADADATGAFDGIGCDVVADDDSSLIVTAGTVNDLIN